MRYTVVENTPGYLPENEPTEFDNWPDAMQHAKQLVQELVQDIEQEGGKAHVDLTITPVPTETAMTETAMWLVVRTYLDGTPEPYALGRVVEIAVAQ